MESTQFKPIEKVFQVREQGEGEGAKVKRYIGTKHLPRLDPFIMLDHFNVKLPAGFPDHPHRGFETVTYMLEGEIWHEDFKGHRGKIQPGDIQWMTAGKGIMHAEMPNSFTEPSIGFQLWLNLEKKLKYCDPQYQEYLSQQIPKYEDDNITAKVIAGEVFGVKGPIAVKTPAFYIDIHMKPGKVYQHSIPKGWNSMLVLYAGSITVQDSQTVPKDSGVVFKRNEQKEEVLMFATGNTDAKFILLAGQPINEPIAQYGPFVLNSESEIQSTFIDYQEGKNGFEGAPNWSSKIRHLKSKSM